MSYALSKRNSTPPKIPASRRLSTHCSQGQPCPTEAVSVGFLINMPITVAAITTIQPKPGTIHRSGGRLSFTLFAHSSAVVYRRFSPRHSSRPIRPRTIAPPTATVTAAWATVLAWRNSARAIAIPATANIRRLITGSGTARTKLELFWNHRSMRQDAVLWCNDAALTAWLPREAR